MKKRVLSLIAVLALVLSTATVVFAADHDIPYVVQPTIELMK